MIKTEADSFNEIFLELSAFKKRKPYIQNVLMERYEKMDEGFEQNNFSLTAQGVYKIGYDSNVEKMDGLS